MEIIDSQKAFDAAIENGILSADNTATNYTGRYMYMYTEQGINYFKNIMTRKYIQCQIIKSSEAENSKEGG